jgi:putative Mn2+ efflux pump MntP
MTTEKWSHRAGRGVAGGCGARGQAQHGERVGSHWLSLLLFSRRATSSSLAAGCCGCVQLRRDSRASGHRSSHRSSPHRAMGDLGGTSGSGGEDADWPWYDAAVAPFIEQLLPSLLLGFGQSVDNFAVGMGYAASGRPIGWLANAAIALVNASGTLLTMEAGDAVLRWLPGRDDSAARAVGGCILILLGTKEIFCGGGRPEGSDSTELPSDEEEEDDEELAVDAADDRAAHARKLWLEVAALAFGLTFTNLAGGFAAGVAGLPLFTVCVISFVRCLPPPAIFCPLGAIALAA